MAASSRPLIRSFLKTAGVLLCVAVLCPVVFARASALTDVEKISPDELRQLQVQKSTFVLFDARNKKSYDTTHIDGAVLPLPESFYLQQDLYQKGLSPAVPDSDAALKESMRGISTDKPIVTYCNRGCQASEVLARQINKLGFVKVQYLDDGLQGWEEKGYPVVIGAPKLSSDSLGN